MEHTCSVVKPENVTLQNVLIGVEHQKLGLEIKDQITPASKSAHICICTKAQCDISTVGPMHLPVCFMALIRDY